MDKESLLLAVLAPNGTLPYTPVQVQKLVFLIQKKLPTILSSKFNFQPYDYGPFDKEVYEKLENLKSSGMIEISKSIDNNWKLYSLTNEGLVQGQEYLNRLIESEQQTIKDLSIFVKKLSFSQLVSAVYKAYPEMKENSVFRE